MEQKTVLTQKQNNQIADIILSTIPNIQEQIIQHGLTKTLPEYVKDAGLELIVKTRLDKTIEIIILDDKKNQIVKEFI
jgi:hypothetical protein